MEVQFVSAAAVRPLRQAILWPEKSFSQLVYDGDDDPYTRHIMARVKGEPVGVMTIIPEQLAWLKNMANLADERTWRLRGMAVVEPRRGYGVGAAMFRKGVQFASERAAAGLWCYSRAGSVGFYTRMGMQPVEEVEVEDLEVPRTLMVMALGR